MIAVVIFIALFFVLIVGAIVASGIKQQNERLAAALTEEIDYDKPVKGRETSRDVVDGFKVVRGEYSAWFGDTRGDDLVYVDVDFIEVHPPEGVDRFDYARRSDPGVQLMVDALTPDHVTNMDRKIRGELQRDAIEDPQEFEAHLVELAFASTHSDAEVWERLANRAQSDHRWSTYAARLLMRYGPKTAEGRRLAPTLAESDDAETRARASLVVDDVDGLLKSIASGWLFEGVRDRCRDRLVELGHADRVESHLVEMLVAESWDDRAAAIDGLLDLGRASSVGSLLGAIDDGRDERMQLRILAALAEHGGRDVVPELKRLAGSSSRSEAVVDAATDAVRQIQSRLASDGGGGLAVVGSAMVGQLSEADHAGAVSVQKPEGQARSG